MIAIAARRAKQLRGPKVEFEPKLLPVSRPDALHQMDPQRPKTRTVPAQRPDSLAAKGSSRARWVDQAMVPAHPSCFG